MMTQRKEIIEFVGSHSAKGLTHCAACDSWVRPQYHAQVVPSDRINIPGLAGRYINIACCSRCGEDL